MEESYLSCQLTPLVSFYHKIVYFVQPPLIINTFKHSTELTFNIDSPHTFTGLQLQGQFGVLSRVKTNLRVWLGDWVVGVES